jgi:hypothetical protein
MTAITKRPKPKPSDPCNERVLLEFRDRLRQRGSVTHRFAFTPGKCPVRWPVVAQAPQPDPRDRKPPRPGSTACKTAQIEAVSVMITDAAASPGFLQGCLTFDD